MRFAQQRSAKVVLMVIPSPRAETNLVEVPLLARLHTNLTKHHAREQPHVPREHVQPNLVIRRRALREVGQVGGNALREHREQRRVILKRRARRRGGNDPTKERREVHGDGGFLPVVVKLQVGVGRLDGGASLDGLATYARAKANDKAPVSLPRALLSRASIAASIVPLRSRPIHESRPSPDPLARVVRTEPAIGLRANRRRLVAVAARATRRPRPVRDARILRIPHDVSTRASRPRPRAFGALARHSDASYPPRIPRDAIRASRLLASTRRDAARARVVGAPDPTRNLPRTSRLSADRRATVICVSASATMVRRERAAVRCGRRRRRGAGRPTARPRRPTACDRRS